MTFRRMGSAGYLLNHLARLFAHELRSRIEPLGVVPGQFPALLELFEEDGQTQRQLLEKLGIEQATLSKTLERMERDGLTERHAHPSDARARTVHLTARARDIHEEVISAANGINEKFLSALTSEEREQFLEMLRRLIASVNSGD